MSELMRFIVFWVTTPVLFLLALGALAHFHKGFGDHLRGMFTDAQNKPSFTRLCSFIALMAVILWVTHIVWKTLAIPPLWEPTMFICAMFSLDRVVELVKVWKGMPQVPQGPTSPPAQ